MYVRYLLQWWLHVSRHSHSCSHMLIRPCLFAVKHCSVLETEHQAATFALIKSLIARQVLLPEVYDLMDDLCQLAVTSQRAPLRTTCSSVFLQYLVSYPLGEKRLTQHLRQVLEGITYEHEVRVCIASMSRQSEH